MLEGEKVRMGAWDTYTKIACLPRTRFCGGQASQNGSLNDIGDETHVFLKAYKFQCVVLQLCGISRQKKHKVFRGNVNICIHGAHLSELPDAYVVTSEEEIRPQIIYF